MSYTNVTPNYKLPQYVPTDKPTYLGDANTAYRIIDTTLAETAQKAQNAINTVQNINIDTGVMIDSIDSLKNSTNNMKAEITTISKTVNSQGTSISNLQKDVQDLDKDLSALENEFNNLEVNATISTADFKKMLLNTAYPVGSIYISTSSTSPASLLGGSWSSINGRFLVAQGSIQTTTGSKSISAGSTGGAYEVYLSDNQSPYKEARDESNDGWGLTRDDNNEGIGFANRVVIMKGNSQQDRPPYVGQDPVTLMPPYLAVYMWKRTA